MKAKFLLISWFLLVFSVSFSLKIGAEEIAETEVKTGACTTTDALGATSCIVIAKSACIAEGGEYGGDDTVCDSTKVNMGAPTGDNLPFDFARSLLLNNTSNESGNLVKNRYSSVGAIVSLIIRYLFLAGGVVFFVLILISGYKLVFLGDKQKALSDVKKNLTTGVMGLLIMFAVFWIIRIIEALTGLAILGRFGL